jgi:hypothetical protein
LPDCPLAPEAETENTIETLTATVLQLTDNFQSWLKGERERIMPEAKDAEIVKQAAEIAELKAELELNTGNLDIAYQSGFEAAKDRLKGEVKRHQKQTNDWYNANRAVQEQNDKLTAQIDWLCNNIHECPETYKEGWCPQQESDKDCPKCRRDAAQKAAAQAERDTLRAKCAEVEGG